MIDWAKEARKLQKTIRLKCFYCDGLVAKDDYEMDHMPLPQSCGGEKAVVACKTCHGMKDRFTMDKWDSSWAEQINKDWPSLSRETRIFLAKVLRIVAEATRIA